ncbi:MAG TPA: hypothetical protein VHD60_02235 [Candidatus Saccharimonadales bacterium]|nr:hypothetical protein [Candidatus Saccharimonadales bacterium]
MASHSQSVYQRVVRISHQYFGPAADRFIIRQVQNHLHKNPEDLSKQDLAVLIDWIRTAVALLTEDSSIVEEYTQKLEALAHEKERPA